MYVIGPRPGTQFQCLSRLSVLIKEVLAVSDGEEVDVVLEPPATRQIKR